MGSAEKAYPANPPRNSLNCPLDRGRLTPRNSTVVPRTTIVLMERFRYRLGSIYVRGSTMRRHIIEVLGSAILLACTSGAVAGPFFFSTGDPDGKMATLSRTASTG